MSGAYIACVIVATELTTALELPWYALAAYFVASTGALVFYYRAGRRASS